MADHDLAKLPKWARERIKEAEEERDELRELVDPHSLPGADLLDESLAALWGAVANVHYQRWRASGDPEHLAGAQAAARAGDHHREAVLLARDGRPPR